MWRALVQAPFGLQCIVNSFGTAFHIQTTWQNTFVFQTVVDAAVHDLPNPAKPTVELAVGDAADFVGALHLGDGFAGGLRHLKHLGRALERVGDRRAVICVFPCRQLFFGQNKPAANRVISLADDGIALGVRRMQDHPIGMTGQCGGRNQRASPLWD